MMFLKLFVMIFENNEHFSAKTQCNISFLLFTNDK